eukprot:7396-Heterococcus_DN1.PRE.3
MCKTKGTLLSWERHTLTHSCSSAAHAANHAAISGAATADAFSCSVRDLGVRGRGSSFLRLPCICSGGERGEGGCVRVSSAAAFSAIGVSAAPAAAAAAAAAAAVDKQLC